MKLPCHNYTFDRIQDLILHMKNEYGLEIVYFQPQNTEQLMIYALKRAQSLKE